MGAHFKGVKKKKKNVCKKKIHLGPKVVLKFDQRTTKEKTSTKKLASANTLFSHIFTELFWVIGNIIFISRNIVLNGLK